MSINQPERERGDAALRELVSVLKSRCDSGEATASEMIFGCRRILDHWINLGGASLDDQVIGFLSIESQTDHVLGGASVSIGRGPYHVRFEPGSPEEIAEIEDCGRCFLGSFRENLCELARHLSAA